MTDRPPPLMFHTLKKFSLRVIVPSVVLIVLVNMILAGHYESNPAKRIEAALDVGEWCRCKGRIP